MTQPVTEPPPENTETPTTVPPVEEDASSLIPALLAVFAAYMAYRAAKDRLEQDWAVVAKTLGLEATLGVQLARIAARALGRQRMAAGRERDELWAWYEDSVRDGVRTGVQVVAEALIWIDQHSPEDPITKDMRDEARQGDEPTPNTSFIPTWSIPPVDLARMVAIAVASHAVVTAAALAGWRFKVWNTRKDPRVRDAHAAAEGQKVPLTESFRVGGTKMRWPGDPKAPIELRINCRCWLTTARR